MSTATATKPVEFAPARREKVGVILGLAGASGSGKSMSALRLARGLAGDAPFAVIDTEARRMLHYADRFQPWEHAELRSPFTPDAYSDAIAAADEAGYPVIVVDSASHEYAGEGGLLDMQEAEFERMGHREAMKMASWIKPKMEHKRFVSRLLQIRAHLILCFRAEEKVEIGKENGKTVVRPKQSLVGLNGWMPVTEKNLPFELTLSFLLTPDAPGVPKPIKLQQQHRAFVPLDAPLTEEVGVELARWATGEKKQGNAGTKAREADEVASELLDVATKLGQRDLLATAIANNRRTNAVALGKHVTWLKRQLTNAKKKLAEQAKDADQDVVNAKKKLAEQAKDADQDVVNAKKKLAEQAKDADQDVVL